MIPYTQHSLDEEDIDAVLRVLRGPKITQGETVARFEAALCEQTGARYAIAVSSGTAALHLALLSLDLAPGSRIVTTPLTFVATAATIIHAGHIPIFSDIENESLLLDPVLANRVEADGAVVVDYAGALASTAIKGKVIVDAAHSFGFRRHDKDTAATCYSFHPAKTITTAEGGAIVTNSMWLAGRARRLRDHGRSAAGISYTAGFNYRMSDVHAALGVSQIAKTARFIARRQQIAGYYGEALRAAKRCQLPIAQDHAWHIYVVRVRAAKRGAFRSCLHEHGIGTQVHYKLAYQMPALAQRYGTAHPCRVAEYESLRVVSLPLYPSMSDAEVERVVETVLAADRKVLKN